MPIVIFLWPFIEIAGFAAIGGKIGVIASLLWVIAAGMAGFSILASSQRMAKDPIDALCLSLAALLFIVPGFISDLLGLALIFPPVRGFIAHRLTRKGFDAEGAEFFFWRREENAPPRATTIEGTAKRLEEKQDK